jgi:hypothetical protein
MARAAWLLPNSRKLAQTRTAVTIGNMLFMSKTSESCSVATVPLELVTVAPGSQPLRNQKHERSLLGCEQRRAQKVEAADHASRRFANSSAEEASEREPANP